MTLASDATLLDVVPKLHDPVAYLLRIKPKMARCKETHGNAFVRIGRRGSGQYPCFRVLYDESGTEKLFGAFIDSGKPFPTQENTSVDWSTRTTSYEEVLRLLDDIRG